MKYTKEQLQFMFSSQLSEIIAELIHHHSFDINNWNDVMPLAVENNLAIMPVYLPEITVWQATSMRHNKAWRDPKMQRAIACCLILVLQEKSNVQN